MGSKLIYLYLQKQLINHSQDNKLSRKEALYWISRLGIPKRFCRKALKIMQKRKLVVKVNRDKIKIIKAKESTELPKSINELIWKEFL